MILSKLIWKTSWATEQTKYILELKKTQNIHINYLLFTQDKIQFPSLVFKDQVNTE